MLFGGVLCVLVCFLLVWVNFERCFLWVLPIIDGFRRLLRFVNVGDNFALLHYAVSVL